MSTPDATQRNDTRAYDGSFPSYADLAPEPLLRIFLHITFWHKVTEMLLQHEGRSGIATG